MRRELRSWWDGFTPLSACGLCRTTRRSLSNLTPTLNRRSVDQQDDLPARVAGFADAVRLCDLGKWEGLHGREGEASGFDEFADFREDVDRATVVAPAEPHAVLLRAGEVGDGHDVPRAARELDQLRQDAATGDVER